MEQTQRPGYDFQGWYVDEELTKRINPAGKLPGRMRLYPKWLLKKFPVEYELEEGINSVENPLNVTVESGVMKLYPAVCAGKQFKSWYLQDQPIEYLPEHITGPVHLRGVFKPHSNIKFETNGGSRLSDKEVEDSGKLKDPLKPIKIGYEFAGWYLDENLTHKWHPEMIFHEDTTLYADWKLQEFEIHYDADGGSEQNDWPIGYTSITPTFLMPKCTKPGFRFLGWYDQRDNLVLMVRQGSIGNLNLKAKWQSGPAKVYRLRKREI